MEGYWHHLNHALEITHHIEPCAQHRLTIPRRRAETSDDADPTHPGSVVPFLQTIDNRTRQNPERHGTAVSGFVLHSQTDTAEGA